MVVSRKPYNENEYVTLGTCERLHISWYNSNKNELKPEIEKRITNVNRAYFALLPILKSQSVLRAEKIKMYKTLTRPVTHRAGSWTLSKGTAKRLACFERKVLRRLTGGIKVNDNWRKLYNKELKQLFRDLVAF
jgi:hypothetical protein